MRVSIHAPREGCDPTLSTAVILIARFQFTHPGRGATNKDNLSKSNLRVSIHAPREGCDAGKDALNGDFSKFQFTHPGRGATRIVIEH